MPQSLLSKARVLIVDDEPSNVRLLERMLEVFETKEILTTTDARNALPLALEKQPDIILLDLNMPHMNGYEVMAKLDEAIPVEERVPVLVLTADITPEAKRRALMAGAKDFLTKPLDHSEVALRIKNLLENRFFQAQLRGQNAQLEKLVQQRTVQLEEAMQELRSTQDAVVKQERLRALGMMAGGIAHDFNNALTMVLGYGELLEPWIREHATSKERTYLRNIVAAAQDATHIVGRLREFYRPAENNEVREPVDVNAIVKQAIDLTSPKWKGKSRAAGIQISVITELNEVPPVAGNAPELREVLTNLIFNAVDAMPQGGAIIVSTAPAGDDRVSFAISDTGIGMTDDERKRCLEPFFTTKGEHGTGLGLSVVYGIVQRHGGSIDITSQKGHGTTFTITLPSTTEVHTCDIETMETTQRPLKILVADDQEVICELIVECLKGEGHTAGMAVDGQQALESFRASPVDLVITDQSMPGMNGVQLAQAIKAEAPDTRVILLTGFGEEMQATGGLPEGVDLVLGKPVSTAALRRAIQQVMSNAEAPTA